MYTPQQITIDRPISPIEVNSRSGKAGTDPPTALEFDLQHRAEGPVQQLSGGEMLRAVSWSTSVYVDLDFRSKC